MKNQYNNYYLEQLNISNYCCSKYYRPIKELGELIAIDSGINQAYMAYGKIICMIQVICYSYFYKQFAIILEQNILRIYCIRAYVQTGLWVKHNGEETPLRGSNFTTHQLFWIGLEHAHCQKVSANTRHGYVASMQNSEHFAKDFNCKKGSGMNPVNKCNVW